MSGTPIAVVGAGIGGLTAALSFAAKGYEVDVFEQAAELREVGAGLQLSPNATRILIRLGLSEALDKAMHRPERIVLASGRTLSRLASLPGGGFAQGRWGAPYGTIHRTSLQELLLAAVRAEPRCRLHLDTRIGAENLSGLDGFLAARLGRKPVLVVGADGVWSGLRQFVAGARQPRFSGQVAWRFMIDTSRAAGILDTAVVTAFLGPATHLVAYPLAGGKGINMVAITPGRNPGETWDMHASPMDRSRLLAAFSDWHRKLRSMLEDAPSINYWPLFEVPDGRWSNDDRLVLIGDAAHAMTPFAAQGAAMAIEDGFELAQAVTDVAPAAITSRLATFERWRRARIDRVRNRAAFNRFAYHARGPLRLGRDLVLMLRPPESLAADLDWLYGYRSPESLD